MRLLKRVGNVVTANLNDVVDRLEDPEKMLRQAVREMEGAIAEARGAAAKVVASEKMLAKEQAEHERRAVACRQSAEQAVAAGDDDDARRALRQKHEHEKLAELVREQLRAAAESSRCLRREVETMQTKYLEAKGRLASLIARKKAADVRRRFQANSPSAAISTDAFARFERLREKVESAEAEADALTELNAGGPSAANREDHTNGHDAQIDAELEQIKKTLDK